MSFESELLAILGGATDAWDIRATVRRCFFYDFDGAPTRLWDGVGTLTTTTSVGDPAALDGGTLAANEWLGTRDGGGGNAHAAPKVKDDRDGTAQVYKFGLPYLDEATFNALKSDQDKVKGRNVTCYHALILPGEGLIPETPIRFSYRLVMQNVNFDDSMTMGDGGAMRRTYSATVSCRSGEAGRSRYPGGTYTDTSQRERARLLGETSDSGCIFVAKNSQRTFTRGA